jgi:hypothetical protein
VKNECVREPELLEALFASRWPDACGSDLRTHVAHCQTCADLAAVVRALVEEHHAATADAHVPSSAIVWWRAQLRARKEAERTVNRPMTVVQGLALASCIGLLVALAGATVAVLRGWLPNMTLFVDAAKALVPALPGAATLLTPAGLLGLAVVALWFVAAPLAVYLAVSDD